MLLIKTCPIGIAAILLLISTACRGQEPSLRFLPLLDTLVTSACGSPAEYHRIQIYNASDSEQAIQLSRMDQLWVTIQNSDAKRLSGRWYVAPHDTVWIEVSQLGRYTTVTSTALLLRSAGGTDTLLVYGRVYFDTVIIEGQYSFTQVKTTDPNKLNFKFINAGHNTYKFERLRFAGLTIDSSILIDSLTSGESKSIDAKIVTSDLGRKQAMLQLNTCSIPHFIASFRVYDPRSHFSLEQLRDSTVGCRDGLSPRDIEVYVRNDHHTATRIISANVINSTAWSIVDSSWRGAIIDPGDSLKLVVHREHGHPRQGLIEIRSDSGSLGRLSVFASPFWSQPRFYVDIDTQYLIWDGFQRYHQYWLTAEGTLPSIIQEVEISDDQHWIMTGPEEGDTLVEGKVSLGEIRFRGNAPPGVYPVDLIVRTSPCDTVLRRTIVMTVNGPSEVPLAINDKTLNIETNTSGLAVSFERAFTYSIFDIRGSLIVSGRSSVSSAAIDLREIPQGTYFLRIESGQFVASRKLAW